MSLFPSLRRGACVLALAAAPAFVPAFAQIGQNGSIDGTLTAPDHTPIPAAQITLTGPDGFARHSLTAPDGSFTLRDLPSGAYTIQAAAPGFQTATASSVPVAIGRTTQLPLSLRLAAASSTVEVTAAPASLDTTQTSSVVNIDRDRVEELPIPSRNYLTFVALSPQAAPANPALTALFPSQSAVSFSFGGLRPGSNAVLLDNVEDDDEYTGTSRTQLSPEAINDFQIVNHGFSAQSGGAAGGSIDVQTRAGLNRPHGDAFLFVQNGALNGTPPLGLFPRKPDESRLRAGVSLGAALQPDRTFFYVAAEQELARGEDVNDLSPATLGRLNGALATSGPLHSFALQSGFFPTTDQETELSARLDHTFSPHTAAMLRYAFTNGRSVNDAFHTDELTDRSARGSSFVADNSLNGTLTSSTDTGLLNKLSLELSQRRAVERTADALANPALPGILIPGAALFGTPFDGNSRRFETHIDLADNLLWQHGRHLVQAGASFERAALRSAVEDGFHGLFVFRDPAALAAGDAALFTRSFGNPDVNLAETRISAFAEDRWTPTHALTLDYGLRYEANLLPAPLPQDAVNFSPRLGLVWAPTSSFLVRSGFGLFYDRFLLSTVDRLLEYNGTNAFQQTIEGPAAAALYRSGTLPSAPLTGIAPSLWRAAPTLPNPYSAVASLSLEQKLPYQTTLTAEYQFVRGIRLGRTRNVNLAPPVTLTTANAPSFGIPNPSAQQLASPFFSPARINPADDAVNQFETTANSTYHGLTVTVNRQFQDDLEILAGYTYSKTLDDASSDLEQPQNPYNPGAERALSLEDQRHRFTLSGLWLIGPDLGDPADAAKNANPGPLMRAFTGFEFAPIVSITSGFHANPLTGLDTNREHIYPFAARPAGLARNSLTTPANIDLDLRILRMVALGPGHLDIVAESFNLLNHPNIALLNTTFGEGTTPQPGFAQPIETSTARRIQFSLDYEF